MEDVSNGLATFETALFIGWVQILAIVGLIDVFNLQTEPIRYHGDYELFSAFGMHDDGSIEGIGSHHHEVLTALQASLETSHFRLSAGDAMVIQKIPSA